LIWSISNLCAPAAQCTVAGGPAQTGSRRGESRIWGFACGVAPPCAWAARLAWRRARTLARELKLHHLALDARQLADGANGLALVLRRLQVLARDPHGR